MSSADCLQDRTEAGVLAHSGPSITVQQAPVLLHAGVETGVIPQPRPEALHGRHLKDLVPFTSILHSEAGLADNCRSKELLSKPADLLTMEEAKTLLAEEEERGRQRRKRKGRIRELEEVRAQLAEKVRSSPSTNLSLQSARYRGCPQDACLSSFVSACVQVSAISAVRSCSHARPCVGCRWPAVSVQSICQASCRATAVQELILLEQEKELSLRETTVSTLREQVPA